MGVELAKKTLVNRMLMANSTAMVIQKLRDRKPLDGEGAGRCAPARAAGRRGGSGGGVGRQRIGENRGGLVWFVVGAPAIDLA